MTDALKTEPKKAKLRVAFISQYFFPEQFSNNQIVKHLVDQGDAVDVICCVPNYGKDHFFDGYSNKGRREETWEGAQVHRAFTVARGTSKWRLVLNYLAFPVFGSVTALKAYRRSPAPDVSFVSMPSPLFQAIVGLVLRARYGTRCVYWVQDIWPESLTMTLGIKSPLVVKPLAWVCGWLYRRADLIMVQSAAFPDMIARFGVDAAKIVVLPNTAPDSYVPLAPSEAEAEGQLMSKGAFKIVFAGNIGESQDFDSLLAAAEMLQGQADVHWYIIGSGRDLARVQHAVEAKGLTHSITFLGRHPEERMPYFFAHADALFVSLKDTEIFALTVPYKVQCYMACGRPILAMLNGEGARIIQRSGAGLATPASDPGALVQSIQHIIAMPSAERAIMAQAARAWFDQEYASDVVFKKLDEGLRG